MRDFIIVDNQDITRAGLMFLLGQEKGVSGVTEGSNKAELIGLLKLHPQAVVVLDYTLLDFNSVDELTVLHARFPEANWLLFSDELSADFLRQLLFCDQSQAFGVVLKEDSYEEIRTAIRCLMHRERFICNHAGNLLLAPAPGPVRKSAVMEENPLTTTEKSILREIAMGKTTKEIAAEKNLSFHTINSHRKNIFRKLGVNNVHEATRYAIKAGIVDLMEYYI